MAKKRKNQTARLASNSSAAEKDCVQTICAAKAMESSVTANVMTSTIEVMLET